ncbi:MAG: hypothetical protein KAS71_10280 [Bacteroidales bacterium]|nr:hypothetical protein [Bacteroidales bacterium]
MSQKKLIQQLELREKELEKELDAIRVLIGAYDDDDDSEDVNEVIPSKIDDNIVLPKGKQSWEDYSIYLLGKLGGKAKSLTVAEFAVKVNPNIKESTVHTAIKAKLSKNFRNGLIDAEKFKSIKDGYLYKIKGTT